MSHSRGSSRREFLQSMMYAGVGTLFFNNLYGEKCSSLLEPSIKPPNILWISCEDISPHLGCYGDPIAKTPNLDKLASEGMLFSKVYTTSPVCAPCRSGIITGMYPTSIGTHHMRCGQAPETEQLKPYAAVPPHYVKAFPEYLRVAGYYCTNNSKTDYQFSGPENPWSTTPVSIWNECSNNAHFKNRPDKNQPFFAVFNLTTTHESQNWGKPEKTKPDKVNVPPYYPDTLPVRQEIARLYDNINKMDEEVGQILQQLEDHGLSENTIVFFWSDHGDGLPRAKRWLYDSGNHIPLIIRYPGKIKGGMVNDDLISSVDFGASVLSLAGIQIPAHMQGQAFLGAQKKLPRKYVFSARDRFDESHDMIRAVRDDKYLYIRNYYPKKAYIGWVPYRNRGITMQEMLRLQAENKLEGSQKLWFANKRPVEELYNRDDDPFQINNLAVDPNYKNILVEMRQVLDEWQGETNDMGFVNESEMFRQMWPGGVQPITAAPSFIPNALGNRAQKQTNSGGTFRNPMTLKLYCPTQGASIVYTIDSGEQPHWHLYSGPIRLKKGKTIVRAKAVRYGFKESTEIIGEFIVQ